MENKKIFEKHFINGMINNDFKAFEKSYPTLLGCILNSMEEVKRKYSSKDDSFKVFTKPVLGETYWTYNIFYSPVKVKILEIDEKKQKARIEQGWIDFCKLYNSEEECPQR